MYSALLASLVLTTATGRLDPVRPLPTLRNNAMRTGQLDNLLPTISKKEALAIKALADGFVLTLRRQGLDVGRYACEAVLILQNAISRC